MSSQSPYGKDLLPSGVYMKAVSFVHTTGKPNLEIDVLEGQVDTVPHVPCTSACIRAFRSDRAASRNGSRWVREMPSVVILSPTWVVTQTGSGFRLPSFVHRREGVDAANNEPSTFDTSPSHCPFHEFRPFCETMLFCPPGPKLRGQNFEADSRLRRTRT